MTDTITTVESTKRCNGCDLRKPLSDFYNDIRSKDGKSPRCRECDRTRQSKYAASLAFRDDSFCGTQLGYQIHLSKRNEICDPCRAAHRNREESGPTPKKSSPYESAPHGTIGAAIWHARIKEPPCAPCLEMKRLYERARDYSISIEALILLTLQFDGFCWSCRILTAEHVDHDHDHGCSDGRSKSCGECIRGVLCQPCNIAEGSLRHWDHGRFAVFADYYGLSQTAQKIIHDWPRVRRTRNQTINDIFTDLFDDNG